MVELIQCNKCGDFIPKRFKKKYRFLWWNYWATKYETDFWHMDQEFGVHLCNKCMVKFKEWLTHKHMRK